MKEEYMGYRVGDRLRMIECKDPYAPISPGTKGTLEMIDDMNTAHMSWDNGRTLGVIIGEDEVAKIPLNEEFVSLDAVSSPEHVSEDAFDAHQERALEAIGLVEDAALESKGAWAARITFLDPAHKGKMPEYVFVEAGELGKLLDGADAKNGVDVGFHKAGRHRSFVIIAHGTKYSSPSGNAHVREAFECRLLKPEVAADYRERMDAGWSGRGEGPRKLFFSRGDQQSLLAEQRKLLGRDKDGHKGAGR